jgi:hypothetical protein
MGAPEQLELPLFEALAGTVSRAPEVGSRAVPVDAPAPRQTNAVRSPPRLSVIVGEGKPERRPLRSRDDLARVLVGAASDLLVRRISSVRAHEIEKRVDRLMDLFDRVDREPLMFKVLQRELDDLEALVKESSQGRSKRPR